MPHGDIFIIETAVHYVCLSPKYLKKKITQVITVTRKASRFHLLHCATLICSEARLRYGRHACT